MGKFFKKEAYAPLVKPVLEVGKKTFKKAPIKTTGTLAGWVLSPGEEAAHLLGYGDRVKDNSLFED